MKSVKSVYANVDMFGQVKNFKLPEQCPLYEKQPLHKYLTNEGSRINVKSGNYGKVMYAVKPLRDAAMEELKTYYLEKEVKRRANRPTTTGEHIEFKRNTLEELLRRTLTNRDMKNFFKEYVANPNPDDNGNVIDNGYERIKNIRDGITTLKSEAARIRGNVRQTAGVGPTTRPGPGLPGFVQYSRAPSDLKRDKIADVVKSQLYASAGKNSDAGDLLSSPGVLSGRQLLFKDEDNDAAGGAAGSVATAVAAGSDDDTDRKMNYKRRADELSNIFTSSPGAVKKQQKAVQDMRILYYEITGKPKNTSIDSATAATLNKAIGDALGIPHRIMRRKL